MCSSNSITSLQVYSPYTVHTYTVAYYISLHQLWTDERELIKQQQEHDEPIKERLKKKNLARHQNKSRMKNKKFQQKQMKQQHQENNDENNTDDNNDNDELDSSSSATDDEYKQTNDESSTQKHNQSNNPSPDDWTESSSHYYERKQHELQQDDQLHHNHNNNHQHKSNSHQHHTNPALSQDDVSSVYDIKLMPPWLQHIYDSQGYIIFNRTHASTEQVTTILIPLHSIQSDRMTVYYQDRPPHSNGNQLGSLAPSSGKHALYESAIWQAN